jgi:hypothetical protein
MRSCCRAARRHQDETAAGVAGQYARIPNARPADSFAPALDTNPACPGPCTTLHSPRCTHIARDFVSVAWRHMPKATVCKRAFVQPAGASPCGRAFNRQGPGVRILRICAGNRKTMGHPGEGEQAARAGLAAASTATRHSVAAVPLWLHRPTLRDVPRRHLFSPSPAGQEALAGPRFWLQ